MEYLFTFIKGDFRELEDLYTRKICFIGQVHLFTYHQLYYLFLYISINIFQSLSRLLAQRSLFRLSFFLTEPLFLFF